MKEREKALSEDELIKEREVKNLETVKSKMIRLMDALVSVVERIAADENAKPEEIAALPALADSVVRITGYATIEED